MRTFFLIPLIILLLGLVIFLALMNVNLVSQNEQIVNAFYADQNSLISICKIDYNEYLALQNEKRWQDINRLTQSLANSH